VALAATGCLSGGDSGSGGGSSGTKAGDKQVEIVFGFGGDQSKGFQQSLAAFEQSSGIKIKFTEASQSFDTLIRTRVAANNLPDIALFPQPGILKDFVAQGKMTDLSTQLDVNKLKSDYVNGTLDAGQVDGKYYGVPISYNLKSLVFYPKKAWAAKGYTVPTTLDELTTLANKIKADGTPPWCFGIQASAATGWPATDWLEQVVLRQGGGTVYDNWVSHAVKFNSPEIISAFNTVNGWMHNPAYVNGGFGDVKTIATTTFQDAGKPILTGQCFMLQQASFYGAQWPTGTTVSETGDAFAFYLPAIGSSVPTPVIGGGEFLTSFSSKPEVQAVQAYLSTPEWATSRIKVAKGWVSANSGADQTAYTDPIDKLSAKYLTDTKATFRFDASDLMPAAVGAGQEWKSMTSWFAENTPISKLVTDIDAQWPS
jgi:alpha-glucoside transport system substrate-binding protein